MASGNPLRPSTQAMEISWTPGRAVSPHPVPRLSSTIGFDATAQFNNATLYVSVWTWAGNAWAVYLPGGDTATYAASKGFGVLGTVGGEAKDFG